MSQLSALVAPGDGIRAPQQSRRVGGLALSVAGTVLRVVIVAFMVAPVLCVVVLSFGQGQTLSFPPQSWGVGLYASFFRSSYWLGALLTSVKLGVPAALISLAVGAPVSWVLSRGKIPFKSVIQLLALSPLILPAISYAIALYGMYLRTNLLYTNIGLILADSVLGIPFVVLIVKAALDRIPAELELAAMSLGAGRRRAVLEITLSLLRPALASSFIMCFMTSFDESTVVQFLGGPGQTTLPKAIFDTVRTGLQPVILAIATILVVGSGLLMIAAGRLRSGRTLRPSS